MTIVRLNPPGSPAAKAYHHVVSAEGGRTVYIAGQIAYDENRNVIGAGDLVAQARQALSNMKRNLEAAGCGMTDVVKITTFVVNYDPADLHRILDVLGEFFPAGQEPANTLIGIERLAVDGLLIEIEAIAVTDRPMP